MLHIYAAVAEKDRRMIAQPPGAQPKRPQQAPTPPSDRA
jgi:hypothetical protein